MLVISKLLIRTLSMINNIIKVFTSKALIVILGFVTAVMLARGLGVENRGVLAGIIVVPQLFISLFEGGVRQAAMYYVGSKRLNEEYVLGGIFQFWAIASIFSFITCAGVIYLSTNYDEVHVIVLASLLVAFDILLSYLRGFYQGKEQFNVYNFSLISPKFILFFIVSYFYFLEDLSIDAVVASMLISSAASALFLVLYLASTKIQIRFRIADVIDLLKKGLAYSFALFLIVANYKIDLFMLSVLGKETDAGMYAVLSQLGDAVWQVPGAVVAVLMARSAVDQARGEFSKLTMLVCKYTLWVTFISALTMFFFLYFFTVYIFGEEFIGLDVLFLYLMPGLVVMVVFKIINSDFAGNGRPLVSMYATIPAVLVNIIGNVLVIGSLGAKGVAIVSSVSYCLAAAIIFNIYKFEYGVALSELIFFNKYEFKKILRLK